MPASVRSPRPAAVKQAGRVLQTAVRVVTVVVLVGAPLLWGGRHPLASADDETRKRAAKVSERLDAMRVTVSSALESSSHANR